MPHRDDTYLYLRSKKELYTLCKGQEAGGLVGSEDFFYRVWREARPKLQPKVGSTFMKCHACTVYKDTLNGTPSVRATQDPTIVEAV
ncbi:unnamed protein product [Sphacelaria rigidula]